MGRTPLRRRKKVEGILRIDGGCRTASRLSSGDRRSAAAPALQAVDLDCQPRISFPLIPRPPITAFTAFFSAGDRRQNDFGSAQSFHLGGRVFAIRCRNNISPPSFFFASVSLVFFPGAMAIVSKTHFSRKTEWPWWPRGRPTPSMPTRSPGRAPLLRNALNVVTPAQKQRPCLNRGNLTGN